MSNRKRLALSSSAYADSKPHYEILNGLRGVAALMVVFYHVFEAFATSPIDQKFNHGYLAVDFFFVLSGFVVSYAYDDRWGRMKKKDFFKRRLIRLHPMIVLGTVLGVITFLIQGSVKWDGTSVPFGMIMLGMVLTFFLIPAYPGTGAEVRGNGEMFPLNGPLWSLFFEYIGNVLYALILRRFSTKQLVALVTFSGVSLASFAVFNLSGYGHLGVGWTLMDYNLLGGFLRVLFAFSIGMLMSRNFKPVKIKGAFWICSLLIAALFSMPYIGSGESPWMNGLYDAICVIFIFPLLVYLAASDHVTDKSTARVNRFLGDISYPLYVVHYPIMYLFYAWVWNNGFTFAQSWHVALGVFVGNILLAYLSLKLYDEPVRRFLAKKLLHK